jgi:hypothetical protein
MSRLMKWSGFVIEMFTFWRAKLGHSRRRERRVIKIKIIECLIWAHCCGWPPVGAELMIFRRNLHQKRKGAHTYSLIKNKRDFWVNAPSELSLRTPSLSYAWSPHTAINKLLSRLWKLKWAQETIWRKLVLKADAFCRLFLILFLVRVA